MEKHQQMLINKNSFQIGLVLMKDSIRTCISFANQCFHIFILVGLGFGHVSMAAESMEFNTDVLDVEDRSKIDLTNFSRAGYITPGTYQLIIHINKSELNEQAVMFMPPEDDPKGSVACLTPDIVNMMGIKSEIMKGLTWWNKEQCLNIHSIKGLDVRGDMGEGALYVNIPQAYLEYTSDNWDHPSQWDDGVNGVLFDYNANAMLSDQSGGGRTRSISGNGTVGGNIGAWRLRADWQAQTVSSDNHGYNNYQDNYNESNADFSRYYVYRAIPSLAAKLMFGENYLTSSMFDSFRYTGASLISDDNMLPPNLRGYAPEVIGIAKTNAKITISQQGRVIYETTVAAGPFRIQDLNTAISGKLDVKVQEQDGSTQTFSVDTANVPYLTRPGSVRYKVAVGKPSDYKHHSEGPAFTTGEFSWGVSNGWSLYGGGILGGDYNALGVGLGRDLLKFGAISIDATQSRAELLDETKTGGSYRLSYSKRFDEYNSQVTFAGYRFAERDFMSMTQYLDARYHGVQNPQGKELYTISFNKQFIEPALSVYFNYSHQTYWDRPDNDSYGLSLSRYFSVGNLNNISANLSAYKTMSNYVSDNSVLLSISMPWGDSGTVSYDTQVVNGKDSHALGYYGRFDDNNSYALKAGLGQNGRGLGSAYFMHNGDAAMLSANASYNGDEYNAVGMSMQGGATVTAHGAALHRAGAMGSTRMMIDTDGVDGVPVNAIGGTSHTNMIGNAVVSDINSYYRSNVSVDLNSLPDNMEATRSVVQATLTEGAIGYRKFGVVSGQKAMVRIKLDDGSIPPFGAFVTNSKEAQVGIVDEGGNIWLSGINPSEKMMVNWSGKAQCMIKLPSHIPQKISKKFILSCKDIADVRG